MYRAHDRELDREVALKLLTGRGAVADPQRLADEARALAKLDHPAILRVYQTGVHQGMPFLVTELVTGGTALDLLQGDAVPEERLVLLAGQLLEALAAAHAAGVLHRDIKPENVLLSEAGDAKLADFGLAKAEGSQVKTRTGIVVGTPEFMAPEIFQGRRAEAASDLFSWGVLCYLLVNRHVPFLGDLAESVRAKIAGRYPAGREQGGMAAAIQRALQPQPAARGDAAQLRALLQGGPAAAPLALTRAMPSSHAVASPGGAPAPARRLPWGAAALGLGLLVAATGALLRGRGGEPEGSPVAPVATPPELDEWVRRLQAVDVAERVAALQVRVAPDTSVLDVLGGNFFPAVMVAARKGERMDANLDVLDQAGSSLPWRREFGAEEGRLRDWLGDPRLPFADRLRLHQALGALVHLDRFWEGWGRLPPYGAASVARVFAPVESLPPDPAWTPAPPLPAGGRLAPGRYQLFTWGPPDPDYPTLFPDRGEPNGYEKAAWQDWIRESQGRFQPARHTSIEATLHLGPDSLPEGAGVALEVQTGGLFLANWIALEVGPALLPYHAEPDRAGHVYWYNAPLPEYRIRWTVPRPLLAEGETRIRLRVRSLPGLPRCCGFGIDHLELRVNP